MLATCIWLYDIGTCVKNAVDNALGHAPEKIQHTKSHTKHLKAKEQWSHGHPPRRSGSLGCMISPTRWPSYCTNIQK